MDLVWIREQSGECPDSDKSAIQAWIRSVSTGHACPSRGSRLDTTPRNAVTSPHITSRKHLSTRCFMAAAAASPQELEAQHREADSPDPPIEGVHLEFVEEPLGVTAEQGEGYLQVDFGERIGPDNRFEILRKLGWGRYVSSDLANVANMLIRLSRVAFG